MFLFSLLLCHKLPRLKVAQASLVWAHTALDSAELLPRGSSPWWKWDRGQGYSIWRPGRASVQAAPSGSWQVLPAPRGWEPASGGDHPVWPAHCLLMGFLVPLAPGGWGGVGWVGEGCPGGVSQERIFWGSDTTLNASYDHAWKSQCATSAACLCLSPENEPRYKGKLDSPVSMGEWHRNCQRLYALKRDEQKQGFLPVFGAGQRDYPSFAPWQGSGCHFGAVGNALTSGCARNAPCDLMVGL